ncbi:MAG: hypothetical protein ACI4HM_06150 [Ruminococcus sp.]
MILNLCLFVFLGYLCAEIYKMLTKKSAYKRKVKIKTPYKSVTITYDEG